MHRLNYRRIIFFIPLFFFLDGNAQIKRLYTTIHDWPIETVYAYAGCGENPALLLCKTDSISMDTSVVDFNSVQSQVNIIPGQSNRGLTHIVMVNNAQLELEADEYASFANATAVYSVKYISADTAILKRYGITGTKITLASKKKVGISLKGVSYYLQPLILRGTFAGWVRVPVTKGKSVPAVIDVYDALFKKQFSITDSVSHFDFQPIGKDSLLCTLYNVNSRELKCSLRDKIGRMYLAISYHTEFAGKEMCGVSYSKRDTSAVVAINVGYTKAAYEGHLLKVSLHTPGVRTIEFNDNIDFISAYNGDAVFHPQGAYYTPGKLLFFQDQVGFSTKSSLNVSTLLDKQLLFYTNSKSNFSYDIEGAYVDVKNKWVAFVVFEYNPGNLSIGKNFLLVCFPDGRNETLELTSGYGLTIRPTENNRILVGKGKELMIYEVK